MGTAEEPNFEPIKKASIVTLIVLVIVYITHSIQFQAAGDWSLTEFAAVRITIIIWGFIVPAALLVLAIVGTKIYQNNEYITLSFGIITVVLSGVLTALSTYWTIDTIINMIENIEYPVIVTVCYGIQLACLAVAIWMQIKSLMTGIDLIKYYQNNKDL